MRTGLVGELGFELHVENEYCTRLYNKMMNIGSNHGLKDAGFRALYSLSCEKGVFIFYLLISCISCLVDFEFCYLIN